jgi:predicted RNase H-like nuclease (RuvC/YqgF family)
VHKDFCVEGFNENEKQSSKKTREKKDLETLIDDLTMQIDNLTKAIATLEAEISEMQVQLKRAGEDREKENKLFQQTVADQRATETLLNKALNVLKAVYAKKAAAALAQEGLDQPAGPPPPPGFKAYKKNAAAGGVMSMINQIIDDAKAMAAEAIKGEEDATAAYEAFVKDTNASIEENKKEIVNKSEEKAVAEGDLQQAQTDKAAVLTELEELSNESADLHKACDFVMKNFEIRQTARDQEIEALKQAKAILSGSKFSAFLERV